MRLLMIAVAVAVLVLGVVAIGGAAADEDDGPLGSFLAKVAEKLGVSEDELKTAIDEARDETIDEAVAEGRLTEDWGERLKERADERGFPFPLPPGGVRLHGHWHLMDAAAEALDMSQDELTEQLRDGNSLAEVAETQGMSVEDFKAALLDQIRAQLDEQTDEIFRRVEENIDDIVNGKGCLRGFGGMRHGPGGSGGMFWFGPGGSGGTWFSPSSDDGAETTETSEVTA
jgi:hypothetical protein